MKSRRRILASFLVLAWTCGVTLARAWRSPNDFATAHWHLDYGLGFVKRALAGTVAGAFARLGGGTLDQDAVGVLGAATVALFSVLLLFTAWRLLVRTRAAAPVIWAGLIFFSSPFLVMTAHLVGYFDAVIHVLALAAVALVLRGRPWAAAGVGSVAILVHESFLLTGLPLVALAVVIEADSRPLPRWLPLALPAFVFLVLTGFGGGGGLHAELAARFGAVGISSAEADRIAAWLNTSLGQFGRDQAREFLPRLIEPSVLARTAPQLAAMLACLYAATGLRALGRRSLLVLAAALAPLLMHAVAWDGARIATYPLFGGFLALMILMNVRPARAPVGHAVLLALPVLFLNVFQHLPLMNDDVERFPILARAALYLPAWILAAFLVVEQLRCDGARGRASAD